MSVSRDDVLNLFIRRWAEDESPVRVIADGVCFSVSLRGFIFLMEGNDRVWIAPSVESAEGAETVVIFSFGDVVSCEYQEAREASLEDRAALESQMVCGVELRLRSRERIWLYELPFIVDDHNKQSTT